MQQIPDNAETRALIDQMLADGRITPGYYARIKEEWEDDRLDNTWGV